MKSDYFDGYYLDDAEYFEYDKRADDYIDFLTHCLIIWINENKEIRYELSLFGIMIVVALIRYSKMDGTELSRHFEKNQLNELKLFNQLPIEEYFEKIATIHMNRLPLIFDIWQSIKTTWGRFSVYLFDPIIDEKANVASIRTPLFTGGIRELFSSIQGTVALRKSKLESYYESGSSVFTEFKSSLSEKKQGIMEYLKLKLDNSMEILRFSGMYSLLDSLEEEIERYNFKSNLKSSDKSNHPYDKQIDFITCAFRDEIQLLFYLNLCRKEYEILLYPISEQMRYPDEMFQTDFTKLAKIPIHGYSPIEKLKEILCAHSVVRKKFDSWINEILKYNQDNFEYIDKLLKI